MEPAIWVSIPLLIYGLIHLYFLEKTRKLQNCTFTYLAFQHLPVHFMHQVVCALKQERCSLVRLYIPHF